MSNLEKRKLHHARRETSQFAPSATSGHPSKHGTSMINIIKTKAQPERQYPKLAPSTVLNKLATVIHRPMDNEPRDRVTRSSDFAEPPSNLLASNDDNGGNPALNRDDRLAIIEDLEPGPIEHTPPSDDPQFEQLEPNSAIRLRRVPSSHSFRAVNVIFPIVLDLFHMMTSKTICVVATTFLLHDCIHLFGYYPTSKDMMCLSRGIGLQ